MPHSSEEQSLRRETIRQLLQRGPAGTQQALVEELIERGLVATQSSVSRDLKELGAIKTTQGYELPASAMEAGEELRGVAEFLRGITPAGPNLTVIRTAIGAAQRVALALDRSGWPEMVGNIGGDDTVFVASDSAASQKILIAKIERARS
jgi:transcriptional regulator of arginine metabolism